MQNKEVPDESSKPAGESAEKEPERKAKEAGAAKADELRNALQTRGEQGKSGMGDVPLPPIDEE